MFNTLFSHTSSTRFFVVIFCLIGSTILMAHETGATAESLLTYDVTVTITPAKAISLGAMWRIYTRDDDGEPYILFTNGVGTDGWRNSGTGVDFDFDFFGYKVEFKSIANWKTPADIIRDNPSTPTSETGIYEATAGSLKVTVKPQDAIDNGARWRRVGTANWQDSAYTEEGLAAGSYNVEFKDVTGYDSPSNQTVTVTAGNVTSVIATYVKQTGSLRVFIKPQGARNDGAKWRLKGTSAWRDSGYMDTGITPGTYTVQFKPTAEWVKPTDQSVTIIVTKISEITGTYTPEPAGSVKIVINPSGIRNNAKWGIGKDEGTATPYSSGDVVELDPGWYVVWFKSVPDKITPLVQEVQVLPGNKTVMTVQYNNLIVGKMKIFGNSIQRAGNRYDVTGQAGFGFESGSAAPADESPSAAYSQKLFNVTGGLQVYPNTNVVAGSGELKFTGNYGPWQVFIDAFALDVIYQGDFRMNGETLKSTDTTDSEAKSNFLGFDLRTLSFSFRLNPFTVVQEAKLVFLPNIFPSETDEYIHIERMVSESGSSFPEIKGRAFMQGAVVREGFFEIKDAEFTFDTEKKNFSGTAGVIQPELGEFNAEFKVADGKLKRITVDIGNISIPLPGIKADVLELSRLYFDLKNPSKDMMKIDAEIVFELLPIDDSFTLAELTGAAQLDMRGRFIGSVDFDVLGYDTGTALLQVFFKGGTQFLMGTGNANILFGLISGFAYIYNQWEPTSNWDNWISATVGVDIPEELQWMVGGKDRISIGGAFLRVYKRGIEATIDVLGLFDISFSLPPFWEGPPNIAPKPRITARGQVRHLSGASPSSVETYDVPANCPSAVFGGCGDNAMPDFVLTDPAGNVYDPIAGFSTDGEDVSFISHESSLGCGFVVKNPSAGTWRLEVRNTSQTGGVNIRFIVKNAKPGFVANGIEDRGDGSYRFRYRAYDANDDAGITFFWCPSNEVFGGIEIGTKTETDGKGHFDWTPGDMAMQQGYVMARIDDGYNSPSMVYFDDRLFIGTEKPDRLRLGKVSVKKDQILTRAPVRKGDDVDYYKVYYNDDIKTNSPSGFLNYPIKRQIKIGSDLLKTGRKYKLWVAAVDSNGVESDLSRRRIVDFRTVRTNNEPDIISAPALEALVGEQYSYTVEAVDYDSDDLTWSLESGPDGMTFDAGTLTLKWTPDTGDIGPKFATVQVTDGKGGSDTQQIVISVSGAGTPSSPIAVGAQRVGASDSRALLVRLYDPVAGSNPKMADRLDATISHPVSGEMVRIKLIETGANTHQFQAIIDLGGLSNIAPSWLSLPASQGATYIKWSNANGTSKHAPLEISGN